VDIYYLQFVVYYEIGLKIFALLLIFALIKGETQKSDIALELKLINFV
jgi:hypothetical protein